MLSWIFSGVTWAFFMASRLGGQSSYLYSECHSGNLLDGVSQTALHSIRTQFAILSRVNSIPVDILLFFCRDPGSGSLGFRFMTFFCWDPDTYCS
jgi:hypothetical protein